MNPCISNFYLFTPLYVSPNQIHTSYNHLTLLLSHLDCFYCTLHFLEVFGGHLLLHTWWHRAWLSRHLSCTGPTEIEARWLKGHSWFYWHEAAALRCLGVLEINLNTEEIKTSVYLCRIHWQAVWNAILDWIADKLLIDQEWSSTFIFLPNWTDLRTNFSLFLKSIKRKRTPRLPELVRPPGCPGPQALHPDDNEF